MLRPISELHVNVTTLIGKIDLTVNRAANCFRRDTAQVENDLDRVKEEADILCKEVFITLTVYLGSCFIELSQP